MSKGKQFGIIEPTERIRVRVGAIRETKITSTTSFSVLGYGVNGVIEVVETALPQAFSPDAEPPAPVVKAGIVKKRSVK